VPKEYKDPTYTTVLPKRARQDITDGLLLVSTGIYISFTTLPTGLQDTKIQKYKNTKIQKYKNTKIQKYKNTKIQKYKNTKIQKYKNGVPLSSSFASG
jgi:hypothetical protein